MHGYRPFWVLIYISRIPSRLGGKIPIFVEILLPGFGKERLAPSFVPRIPELESEIALRSSYPELFAREA